MTIKVSYGSTFCRRLLLYPLQERLGVVYGDGEGDARRDLHGVDPDGLAVQVDEGAAGVAEGDGGVGLDVVGDVAVAQAQFEAVAEYKMNLLI